MSLQHQKCLFSVALWLMFLLPAAMAQTPDGTGKEKIFAGAKTFSWLSLPKGDWNPMGQYRFAAKEVQQRADEILANKGYQRVEEGADLWVVFYGSNEERLKIQAGPYMQWGPEGWLFSWGNTKHYGRKGPRNLLVIDVIDAKTGELLWQGSTRKRIHGGPVRYQKKISRVVAGLLEDLPTKVWHGKRLGHHP